MLKVRWLAAAACVAVATAAGGAPVELSAPPGSTVEVYFSPNGGADLAVARAIDRASRRVWIAGYYFTSTVVAKALRQASGRGLDVRVVLDRSQATSKYSGATYLYNERVPVKINQRYPIMHHKFLVIDADSVGLGSMNFTKSAANQNAENFNIFHSWPALANTYAAEFTRLERESDPYRPGMQLDRPPESEFFFR